MILATEALRLPTAQLTNEEVAAADKLEKELEAHIRQKMERRGCEFQTREKRANVIAELNQRLKVAGWEVQWQALVEQGKFSRNNVVVGYAATLAPTDEVYRNVDHTEAAGGPKVDYRHSPH